MLINRRTISRSVRQVGIGLHTGESVSVRILPSDTKSGIRFMTMLGSEITCVIPALINNIRKEALRTSLGIDHHAINTIEHLMAAFSAHGITDADVMVWGSEIPMLDGTAMLWMELIQHAGIIQLDQCIDPIIVKQHLEIFNGSAWCSISPCDRFLLDYELGYDHPLLIAQHASIELSLDSFLNDIAAARTFGFRSDLESLHAVGLSKAAGIDNVLVFDDDGAMNRDGMRWANEPARHKIMDAVGDLYLAGRPIIGHFRGHHSGHAMNHELVRMLIGYD